MEIKFLKPAELELDDAITYYDTELFGLGELFQNEILRAIKRIKAYPESYQQLSKLTRRCLVSKFPYGIVYCYRESKNEIIIVAIAHLHRKPEKWQRRLPKK